MSATITPRERPAALASFALRSGADADDLTRLLEGVGCNQPTVDNGVVIASCVDAVARALKLAGKDEHDVRP